MDTTGILAKAEVILLDIEGTTTSISFVKDTLFPYARQHLDAYLRDNWHDDHLKDLVESLCLQAEKEAEAPSIPRSENADENAVRQAVIANVCWLMDLDRKATPLKKLQGHIWKHGFDTKQLLGHVFSDVAPTLQRWSSLGKRLAIYSSGSIEAQQVMFSHTTEGALTKYLEAYFDTNVGPKSSAESYMNISKAMNVAPEAFLFLTDIPAEAYAAKKAGFAAILVIRPGNAPLPPEASAAFPCISSLDQLH